MTEPNSSTTNQAAPAFSKRRSVILGKDSDSIIKSFFGSSATVALVVLTLITIFLFKEGAGFIGLYHKSLQEYRLSGLEYVDILKEKREGYTALTRFLNATRAEWINSLKDEGKSQQEIRAAVSTPEAKALFMGYMRTGSQLRKFIKEKMDAAIEIRDQHLTNQNLRTTLANYTAKITLVSDPDYALKSEDRAQFILRLNEYNSSNSLQTERIAANKQLIEALGTNRPINTEARALFVELLNEKYAAIEATIVPVDFSTEIQRVTSGQEHYAEILAELENSIQGVLSHAAASIFKTTPSAKKSHALQS